MELIGVSGYALAAIAYFIFTLLLLAARNHTLSGYLVIIGSLLVLASSVSGALQIDKGYPLQTILIFETFKLAIWSVLILCTHFHVTKLKQLFSQEKIKKYLQMWLLLSVTCWLAALYTEHGVKYLFLLFLFLNLWLLVQLEQLYRNADVKAKWALWSLVLALGTSTVFDFILFAQAAMVNQIDFDYWYIRGFVAALGMPLMLVSTRRIKDWSVNVFVSRDVVFYSSMLLMSGFYLLLLALAGYVINYIGGEWGDIVSIAFFVLGGMVLAALLITERFRREVKVFITKHFFANKYDYRIEWLKSIELLDVNKPDDYHHTAMKVITSSLEITKGALIKRVSLGNYRCLYQQELPLDKQGLFKLTPVDEFCEKHGWIIDMREYASEKNSYPELEAEVEFFIKNNIDIILPMFKDKTLYGFFLLTLPPQKKSLNWEDRDLLVALSKQLSNYLSLNEANEKLAEAKQFDAFNRMSAFLVHDLKNIQAQLGLINNNAKRHRNNPEFIDDVFETIDSATSRLEKVLAQLRNKQVAESSKKRVNITQLIEKVKEQRNVALPKVSIEITNEIEAVLDSETFFSVLNHLVQNAQEATKDDGWVKVRAELIEQDLHIAVLDNGSGMSEDFIKNRLFKPFDTTKGNAGMGIGVFEAKQFVEGLGGVMQVTSFEGEGSIFHLSIPCE